MEAAAYGAMYGFMAVFMAIYWVVLIGILAIQYVAQWKIFVKAGEPGWKCLVPFLNGYTLYKLFWKPVYYWLTLVLGVIVCVLVCIWAAMTSVVAHEAWFSAFTVVTWLVYAAYLVVAIVWSVKLYLGMSRSFGYGGGFAAGLVLVNIVFMLILAFGKDTYKGNTYIKQAAPTAEPWTRPPVIDAEPPKTEE